VIRITSSLGSITKGFEEERREGKKEKHQSIVCRGKRGNVM